MGELEVEIVSLPDVTADPMLDLYDRVPVVRLSEVDQVLAKAIVIIGKRWHDIKPESLSDYLQLDEDAKFEIRDIEAFLASPVVTAFKERQGGTSCQK
ncbi:MAG: hypothetical protein KGL39_18655 [Patescibacteria group bacterium]|nr:hypothetical protein [Patescibacteria group bacterium]